MSPLAVEMVETANDFAAELEVRHLVAPDRHVLSAHDSDVAELQQRIPKKTVGCDLLAERFDLSLIGRHAFEPRDRRDHRKQHEEFADLRHGRLQKNRRALRIDAGGEPDCYHLFARRANLGGIVEIRRVRVQVGDLEERVGGVAEVCPLR